MCVKSILYHILLHILPILKKYKEVNVTVGLSLPIADLKKVLLWIVPT